MRCAITVSLGTIQLILSTQYSSLITCITSLFSQRIEIVSFFFKQTFVYQPLHRIEDSGAGLRIVFAGFKESVQIELLFLPQVKTSQDESFYFIHGGISLVS